MSRRMSVDPGISGAGYALWEEASWDEFCVPVKCGLVTPRLSPEDRKFPPEVRWRIRCHNVCEQLRHLAIMGGVHHIYSEMPTYFESKSFASKNDDIIKLTYAVAMLEGLCISECIDYSLIGVNDWKGQLRKEEVERRIKKAYSNSHMYTRAILYLKSHEFDAVGIGLHAKEFRVISQKERI